VISKFYENTTNRLKEKKKEKKSRKIIGGMMCRKQRDNSKSMPPQG